MVKRDYDLLETIKIKRSMAAQIVKKDRDYSEYAGADPETAQALVFIKFCKDQKVLPPFFNDMLNLMRALFQQKRKAFFASAGSTELTKLGFIQGEPQEYLSALEEVE